jgi:hypothetical protein
MLNVSCWRQQAAPQQLLLPLCIIGFRAADAAKPYCVNASVSLGSLLVMTMAEA